jgi:hypothetical protein
MLVQSMVVTTEGGKTVMIIVVRSDENRHVEFGVTEARFCGMDMLRLWLVVLDAMTGTYANNDPA